MILAATFSLYTLAVHKNVEPVISATNGFELSTYGGTFVRMADFRRERVVAMMWASWCPYCADQLAILSTLSDEFPSVTFLAVNRAESLPDASRFTDPLGLSSRVTLLLDPDDAFFKEIQGYAMPEVIGVNESGELMFHERGPITEELLRERISALAGQ